MRQEVLPKKVNPDLIELLKPNRPDLKMIITVTGVKAAEVLGLSR
jgi:hypothetical protein